MAVVVVVVVVVRYSRKLQLLLCRRVGSVHSKHAIFAVHFTTPDACSG